MGKIVPRVVAIEQAGHIGDVISCLPMVTALKRLTPAPRIVLIGKPYTQALVEACVLIDEFIDVRQVLDDPAILTRLGVEAFVSPFLRDDCGRAAKAAGVPIRVGNLRRPRTLPWATRFIWQGSRHSAMHIADLNLSFLRPLGIHGPCPAPQQLGRFGFERIPPLDARLSDQLDPRRFNLILHPKSNKNAREWPLSHFAHLVDLLPAQTFKIFVTGVAREREDMLREYPAFLQRTDITDLTGTMTLAQFIGFINRADGLLSNSTGPLHIAASVGIHALGLFPGRERANPRRWGPLGLKAEAIAVRDSCKPGPGRCPKDYKGEICSCMQQIDPAAVALKLRDWARTIGAQRSANSGSSAGEPAAFEAGRDNMLDALPGTAG
jgi:heptosyltransferase-3